MSPDGEAGRCRFAGLALRSPLVLLSGTAAYGRELAGLADLSDFGALVGKTITLRPRAGNPPPRTAETHAGLVNSIGLANGGLDDFLARVVPDAATRPVPLLASIAGTARELAVMAEAISAAGVPGIEVNLSCPNVAAELRHHRPASVTRLLARVRDRTTRPLLAKLPPDLFRIADLVRAAERAGVDGLTVANTFPALVFDRRGHGPLPGGITGGLSGPAILPLSLYLVYQARRVTALPILGSGGVHDAASARDMFQAGATAIGLGTIIFSRPDIGAEIRRALFPVSNRPGRAGT